MLQEDKSILRREGYEVYTRPYELNIVGLRSKGIIPNRFDDEIHVFYRVSPLKWNYHVYKATTDPGTFWLLNPEQPQGTAVLAQGQYVNAYEIGLHKGEYESLLQKEPVTVIRQYERIAYLDFMNGQRDTGVFGIDIHRAKAIGTTQYVDEYSAGCQVFQNADDFGEFMGLCNKHKDLYGNSFTYTLIDYRAKRREAARRMLAGAFTLGLGLLTWYEFDQE
jgi:hypothetical protein